MLIAGVTVQLQGVKLPTNSLVDIDDILQFPESSNTTPANGDEYHNRSLLCLTDLEDCCSDTRQQGEWYYPDGDDHEVTSDTMRATFQQNRGENQVIGKQQFYGSVRLFRRGNPPERGRFHCELPSQADPSNNQTIYVNICE